MNISWGKVTIKYRTYKSTAYQSADAWSAMSIPVEGSTTLNITEGDTKEAKQEGGAVVDSVTGDNTYELVWRIFVKKTDAQNPYPIDAVNGKVTGEHAFRLIPEDNACLGIEIPRASVRVLEQFSSDEGITLEYHAKAILDNATADASGATGNVIGHYGDGRLIKIKVIE